MLIGEKNITLGVRIRELRRAAGLNQTDFGKLMGVSQVAVSNWEKDNDVPNAKILNRLAGMTADNELRADLLERAGAIRVEPIVDDDSDIREIKLLRDPAAAGTPRVIDENVVDRVLKLPRSLFPSGGELYGVRIAGDSMAPILLDGHIVIINVARRDPRRLVEHMVAAREGDGVTIKWLRRDGDSYILMPQHVSPMYPVRIMRPEGDYSIVGEVVCWIGAPPPVHKLR